MGLFRLLRNLFVLRFGTQFEKKIFLFIDAPLRYLPAKLTTLNKLVC